MGAKFQNEVEMDNFDKVVMLIFVVIQAFAFSYAFSYMWGLFAVPLGAVVISPLYAYGLALTSSLITVSLMTEDSIRKTTPVLQITRVVIIGLICIIGNIAARFL